MNKSVLKSATKGLAGAVALAGGTQAYGAVVFVAPPANFIPTSGVTAATGFQIDVNNDGTKDIGFLFFQASTTGNWTTGAYGIGGVGTAATVGYLGAFTGYATRLSVGNAINTSSAFYQNGNYVNVLASRYSGTFYGQFTTAGTPVNGWVGFEFTAADGLHFGAINVTTDRFRSAANPGGIRYFTLEYQSVAGAPLVITAVPEPGTLAALAFGVAGTGVALRRRSKKAAQQAA